MKTYEDIQNDKVDNKEYWRQRLSSAQFRPLFIWPHLYSGLLGLGLYMSQQMIKKGSSINHVVKILSIFDPPPSWPLLLILKGLRYKMVI